MEVVKFKDSEKKSILKLSIEYGLDTYVDKLDSPEGDSEYFYTISYWLIKSYLKGRNDILDKLGDK